jgi:hypothetical protein
MEVYSRNVKNFLDKYKKRIVLVSIGGLGAYYLYKKFLSEKVLLIKDVYRKLSEYNELFNINTTFDTVTQQFEGSFTNLMSKLLEEVNLKIENHFSINKCLNNLQIAPKEELMKFWTLFKNKTFICFYCSIIVTRIMLLLSQTHLLILEKANIQNSNHQMHFSQKGFYDDLLTDLWILATEYIEFLLKYIENKLSSLVDEIHLNSILNKEKLSQIFSNFRNRVEEVDYDPVCKQFQLKIFSKYFHDLETKITILESIQYKGETDPNSFKIHSYLKFYQIYYDIITSNLFQSITVKALDYDFQIIEDLFERNYENEASKSQQNLTSIELSVPKITSFINVMRKNLLDPESTIFVIKSFKSLPFPDELNEYFRIVYD